MSAPAVMISFTGHVHEVMEVVANPGRWQRGPGRRHVPGPASRGGQAGQGGGAGTG